MSAIGWKWKTVRKSGSYTFKMSLIQIFFLGIVFSGIFLQVLSQMDKEALRHRRESMQGQTKLLAELLKDRLSSRKTDDLQETLLKLNPIVDARISVLHPTGQVIADSAPREQWEESEYLRYRPEVEQALREGSGFSVRKGGWSAKSLLFTASCLYEEGIPKALIRLSAPAPYNASPLRGLMMILVP